MRHYLHLRGSPRTPAARAQGVFEAPGAASLVAPTCVALQGTACAGCAGTGAIALTPIAMAANQDLLATTRAQEESGRLI